MKISPFSNRARSAAFCVSGSESICGNSFGRTTSPRIRASVRSTYCWKARAVAAFNSVPNVLGETKTQTKESTTTRTLLALSRELRRSVIVGDLRNRHRVSVLAIEAALAILYDLFYRLLRAAMP